MTARSKQLRVAPAIDADTPSRVIIYQAPPQKSACKMIDPENMDELAQLLHNEARVI
jgi:electron transfer flavoprotein beta subunit